MAQEILIVGGGLAGCEAAWQAARLGVSVLLYEMKPESFSPAHVSTNLAELVCSNSFRSNSLHNAVGLLKEEMRRLDSLILRIADQKKVPAGDALAVDRQAFSAAVTATIESHPRIHVLRQEISRIPEGVVIIASGPLTSPSLSQAIQEITGQDQLYFYDAIAPIIDAGSLNREVIFRASRYGEGSDYLNCPMTLEEYRRFVEELLRGEKVPYRDFEKPIHFEGCLPIEEMAARGLETLAHGPLKPVGLIDPRTGKRPYAVVQLRQEDGIGSAYNMVGFQTKLKWNEQQRIFRMIPGLEKAQFLRFGSLHRNTYLNSPALLEKTLQLKILPRIFFAGQITGVEGYVESSAMGILAGINAARMVKGDPLVIPPPTTALGALLHYITNPAVKRLQPMNIHFGLFPPLFTPQKGKAKHLAITDRALRAMEEWIPMIRSEEGPLRLPDPSPVPRIP